MKDTEELERSVIEKLAGKLVPDAGKPETPEEPVADKCPHCGGDL